MKKYYLAILGGSNTWSKTIEAKSFDSSSDGYYRFYDRENKLMACYPINRTIIERIENL